MVLLVIAAHTLALQRDPDIPPVRRRIRTANGVLMMFTTALLAYAISVVTPATPSAFALAWLAVVGLLAIIITVALLDAAHTLRLHAQARRELRREATRPISKEDRREGSGH
ncbi:MAG: hypothetical protein DIU60_022165 [Actinomycetes bacterium]